MKCLTQKGNKVVRIVVEKELEHLSYGAATSFAVEFIEPAIKPDVIKSVVNRAGDGWNQMCYYVSCMKSCS